MPPLKARGISLETSREVQNAESCLQPICEADYRDTMVLATSGDQTYHSITDIPPRKRLGQSSVIYYRLPGGELQRLGDEVEKLRPLMKRTEELEKEVIDLKADKVCRRCLHDQGPSAIAHSDIVQAEQLFLTTYRDPLGRWFDKVAGACSTQPGFPTFGHTWGELAGALEDEDNLNEPNNRPVTSSLKTFLASRGVDWQRDWLPLRELSRTATGTCHQGKNLSWRQALADLQAGKARVPDGVSHAKRPLMQVLQQLIDRRF